MQLLRERTIAKVCKKIIFIQSSHSTQYCVENCKQIVNHCVCRMLLSFCMFHRPRSGMVLVSACLTIHSFSSGMLYFYMYTFILCVVLPATGK